MKNNQLTVTERMVLSVMNKPCKTFDKGRAAMLGITLKTYQIALRTLKAKM